MKDTQKVFQPRKPDYDRGWKVTHISLTAIDPITSANDWKMISLGIDLQHPTRQRSYLFFYPQNTVIDKISNKDEPNVATRRSKLFIRGAERVFDGSLASVGGRRRSR